jgi:hypothetical protein
MGAISLWSSRRGRLAVGQGMVEQLGHSAFALTDPSERLSRTRLIPRFVEGTACLLFQLCLVKNIMFYIHRARGSRMGLSLC